MTDNYTYTFTVFTPVYNREHTIDRVFESLVAQTFKDFEWLIVDDGSTDNIKEKIIHYQRISLFPISYRYQDNAGKHIACNNAVKHARGAFFLTFDSDDACIHDALQILIDTWTSIPEDNRHEFSAVTGLCVNERYELVGTKFPYSPFDSNSLDSYYKYKIRGEKWGFQKTDVMKEFLFEESIKNQYVFEGSVWTRIARKYKTRYINIPLRIYYSLDVGHVSIMNRSSLMKSSKARYFELIFTLNNNFDYFRFAPLAFLKSFIQLGRSGFHSSIKVFESWSTLNTILKKILLIIFLPSALLLYQYDMWKQKGE